jgi:hypothetical protein
VQTAEGELEVAIPQMLEAAETLASTSRRSTRDCQHKAGVQGKR